MTPFLGQIMQVGFNFAPRGWALCDGALLPISQYSALFSLLGTTFGGDGRSTFGLPELRGRVAVHVGHGPGLSTYNWGQKGGAEQVSLTSPGQLPSHNHLINVKKTAGDRANPNNDFLAVSNFGTPPNNTVVDTYSNTHDGQLNNDAVTNTGSSQGHDNIQPYLAIYWIIALEGIFPSRS